MDDKLYDILLKLPRKNLIHIMWESLDFMQGYNGRSRQHCVLESMGAKIKVKDDGRERYVIESLADVKRHSENMGL